MSGRTEFRSVLARLAVAGVCAAAPLAAVAAPAAAAPFDCHVWDGPTLPGERCYPHERPEKPPRREPHRPTPSDYFGPGWFGSS